MVLFLLNCAWWEARCGLECAFQGARSCAVAHDKAPIAALGAPCPPATPFPPLPCVQSLTRSCWRVLRGTTACTRASTSCIPFSTSASASCSAPLRGTPVCMGPREAGGRRGGRCGPIGDAEGRTRRRTRRRARQARLVRPAGGIELRAQCTSGLRTGDG